MRARPISAAADEDEKEASDRGSLDGDILFWGKDGQPYDEAADWEAAGGQGGLTVEQIIAASGEEASAEKARPSFATSFRTPNPDPDLNDRISLSCGFENLKTTTLY